MKELNLGIGISLLFLGCFIIGGLTLWVFQEIANTIIARTDNGIAYNQCLEPKIDLVFKATTTTAIEDILKDCPPSPFIRII